jgi:hypothetical protein
MCIKFGKWDLILTNAILYVLNVLSSINLTMGPLGSKQFVVKITENKVVSTVFTY